jgi:DNA-directed RNA polymerase subunit M/transcription elongation factor TFIIS
MEEEILNCPKCGGLLVPMTYQAGLYSCELCGDVEDDGDGFIVNGKFYPANNKAEDNSFDDTEQGWYPDDANHLKELTLGDVFGDVDLSGESFDPTPEFEAERGRNAAALDAEIEEDTLTDDFFGWADDTGNPQENF